MRTIHRIVSGDARRMSGIVDDSVDLILTSPPYPMIEMWDEVFERLNPEIATAMRGDTFNAFELMHKELDCVWRECFRVLKTGGFACINIGDATRTIDGDFCLYSNHARILRSMVRTGFTPLPDILWRKPTNAPNKFMGSGMLPAGAYVTYEHEYVLIFRKGPKRSFVTAAEKLNRQRSAFFWEERNIWFSDVWFDLRGTPQHLLDPETRRRSAAFPLELPYRLIQMYSVMGDAILDPFLGTGTTTLAAMMSGRNSVGVEIDSSLTARLNSLARSVPRIGAERIKERLAAHGAFIEERQKLGRKAKYTNVHYEFPVVTRQEVDLRLPWPTRVRAVGEERLEVHYTDAPEKGQTLRQTDFLRAE